MSLDRAVIAERVAAVERHLRRVAERLPVQADDLRAGTDAADVVLLHLWQATQTVIDLAVSWSVARGLGSPESYGDAFRRLQAAGLLDAGLADRLSRAAGFRNVVAHEYGSLDMRRVHQAACNGPVDLRAFLTQLSRSL